MKEAVSSLEAQRSEAGPVDAHAIDDLLHRYKHRLAALMERPAEGFSARQQHAAEQYRAEQKLSRAVKAQERRTVVRLRDEGRIGDDVLRRLERELDLVETQQSGR